MNFKFWTLLFVIILTTSGMVIHMGTGVKDLTRSPTKGVFSNIYYAGGNGTIDDPYQISDVNQLQNISLNLTDHYILINDIDASATAGWNSNRGFDPIGDSDVHFKGTLNGQNFTISDLWIDRTSENFVGLFSIVEDAWVHHLSIEDAQVRGNAYAGIIAGIIYQTKIENCTISGGIEGLYSIGGLGGYSSGDQVKIVNTTTSVAASNLNLNGYTFSMFGGIIGQKYSGEMINCLSKGPVTISYDGYIGCSYIGGMIGYAEYGRIEECTTTGKVTYYGAGRVIYFGGLIGYNRYQEINDCQSTGELNIRHYNHGTSVYEIHCIGGLTGWNNGPIYNCNRSGPYVIYSTRPNGNYLRYVGGIAGVNYYSVTDCSSRGIMDITISGDVYYIGGLNGYSSYHVSNSVSKMSIKLSGNTWTRQLGGLIGYNNGGTVTSCGWEGYIDLSISVFSTPDTFDIGGLIGLNVRGGVSDCYSSGSIDVEATSCDAKEIGGLVGDNNDGDISDSRSALYINVTSTGANKVIEKVGGLVGYNNNDGSIVNCQFFGWMDNIAGGMGGRYIGGIAGHNERGTIIQSQTFNSLHLSGTPNFHSIGGLAGKNDFYIDGCLSAGWLYFAPWDTLSQLREIGGLVGFNNGGSILKSATNTSIFPHKQTGKNFNYDISEVGGLVGKSTGSVKNCFANGTVSVNASTNANNIGGLVGWNSGTIDFCYTIVAMYFEAVFSANDLGGLVGENSGSIYQCYSVFRNYDTGESAMGGVLGRNSGTGQLTGCFYDKDSTSLSEGVYTPGDTPGVYENSTIDMMKRDWYEVEGWKFREDWGIIEDRIYPFLFVMYHYPTINLQKPDSATEDVEFIIDYKGVHSPYPVINRIEKKDIILHSNADWLRIYKDSNRISGIPLNEHIGSYWLDFSLQDTFQNEYDERSAVNFTFEVINVNDPPQIVTVDILNVTEKEYYSQYYYAVDEDPRLTQFTWTMATNASWLDFEGNHLFGTPIYNSDLGEFWVNVSVMDFDRGLDFTNFTLTVFSDNDPPVITSEPVLFAIEDQEYRMNLTAFDPDLNDIQRWEMLSGPEWLRLYKKYIGGTPENEHVGYTSVKIRVSDFDGAFDEVGFLLEVRNTNDAPEWVEAPEDQNITEGDLLILNAIARDMDIGDELEYSLTSEPEANISIHPVTGTILWLDTNIGEYVVNVTASDGEAEVWKEFKLIVNEKPYDPSLDNHPPFLIPIEDQVAEVGKLFSMEINATDEDGDILIYSVIRGAPGMSISGIGELVWTPLEDDLGTHTVNISVSDGRSMVFSMFLITVMPGDSTVDDDDDAVIDDDTADDDATGDDDDNGKTASDNINATVIYIVIIALAIMVMFMLTVHYFGMTKEEKDLVKDDKAPVKGKIMEKEEAGDKKDWSEE
ncbi:MAG: GLUG motif-containing protein [Thermoplasmatota archaeon]